jgi:hypothetical protein
MRDAKQLAIGGLALASIPVVAWFSFKYHFLVGVIVTIIYGSAASLVGLVSIGRSVLSIATQLRDRARAKRSSVLPEARLLDSGPKR